ncbi:heterokaryon incompatibility protein-domain-containing protein [Hypoxylon crocopeplum]|nr:heterokaryon incompatibility protein-domain-containing protein [Hypoxylon crocopeplum]
MRLLDAHTLEIREYYEDIPPYAILSHTWSDGEVSFVDLVKGKNPHLKGYDNAISEDLDYLSQYGPYGGWIDTCCIDRRIPLSSPKLSNPMFKWYRDSVPCCAYLEDATSDRWFTGGWKLQGLPASPVVLFFSSDYVKLGTKDQLQEIIAKPTRIDRAIFSGNRKFSDYHAYSLLGIFGVNMPLIYGEGKGAFVRL